MRLLVPDLSGLRRQVTMPMFDWVGGNVDQIEASRVAAVHRYNLLDPGLDGTPEGPVDEQIEALARVAGLVAGAATVTVNLIDAHRQCSLSAIGTARRSIPRDGSLCASHFTTGEPVHVPGLPPGPVDS
jgi:hypothetical protein